ncbi:MAG: class I SAM-dependent methyltransferase [Bacteroidota bacterium]
MVEINLLDRYPKSKRPVEERGNVITDDHRKVARKFGKEYFDGNRLSGYGGYHYHPRFWEETVKRFKDYYHLDKNSAILDVGCAKGFMLHDFKQLIPDMTIAGIDISKYAIENAIEDMRPYVQIGNASELPYADKSFDLVISINTIHNLPLDKCKKALQEIERVSRSHAFISVDAWRNEQEKENLMKWNLTAQTYMHVEDWKKIFEDVVYTSDYNWFIIE